MTFLLNPKWLPRRYATLLWICGIFLVVNALVRLGLTVLEADWTNYVPLRLAGILGVGLVYDLAVAAYLLVPFALIALVLPNGRRGRFAHGILVCALVLTGMASLLLAAVAEVLFWEEFSSRFNFIAVDYLIYTREVLGNIRESYPVGVLLGGVAAVALAAFGALCKPLWRAAAADGGTLSRRLGLTAVILLLPLVSFWAVGDRLKDRFGSPSARELAGNGYYEFMRAFRANDLDYQAFYKTVPFIQAEKEVWAELVEAGSTAKLTHVHHPMEREIAAAGPARPLNVVLVSIESLGADYVESLDGVKGLTPNLDRLAAQGLLFTRIYATGLRTVRGLEALALSIPPTPGQAVPARKNNKGFQSVGQVFREHGYETLYLYGGYSYFDNMRDFFEGNGYTVVDRTAIPKAGVTHETIWGVADEDLFRQAIREIDERTRAGKRVFAHIMTTSNHRPFTYPAGRIDIPPGTGRDGAVKYSDWAIGQFVDEASRQPWFGQTVFVFIADHTSHGRGRIDLPPENYHIPLIVYAPRIVPARRIDTLASQIDVGPTLLALLDMSYTSRFFGQDILTEGAKHQRAFMSNYLTVGYMEGGVVVELSPKRRVTVVEAETGNPVAASDPRAREYTAEAVGYYEVASQVLHDGGQTRLTADSRAARPPHKL